MILGIVLFGAIGIALNWRPPYSLTAGLAFGATVWLSQSLVRATMAWVASLGLIAATVMVLGAAFPDLPQGLGVQWSDLFFLSWAVTLAVGVTFRLAGLAPDFGVSAILGAAIGLVIALFVAAKIDTGSNLLLYLLGLEDNAAWVGLATQAKAASGSVGPVLTNSTLGPLMPLMLGLLGTAQRGGTPWTNSVFASYTLAIVLTPLVTSSLIRNVQGRPLLAVGAFVLVAVSWAYLVPTMLFGSFGHLSAIWAFVALLLIVSLAEFDLGSPWLLPAVLGATLFLGCAWFPIAPLAAVLAACGALLSVRRKGPAAKALVAVVIAVAGVALAVALYKGGVSVGSGASRLGQSLQTLYRSDGGTAELNPLLILAVLGGTVALSIYRSKLGNPDRMLSLLLLVFVGYLVLVTAGAKLLGVTDSYGVKKVTFVVGFSATVALIAILARQRLSTPATVSVILSLALLSFSYGGASELLTRSWPGEGTKPVWLPAVQAAVGGQPANRPRPVACFSSDAPVTYQCTRWAGALTAAGDGAYLPYRLDIVENGAGNMPRLLKELAADGTLASSDVIVIDPPGRNGTNWGNILIERGGRVLGIDGEPLKTSR